MRLTASHMEITNITEYESVAKEKLPKMIYDYYASGVGDQWTLKENRFRLLIYGGTSQGFNAHHDCSYRFDENSSRSRHCLHWLHLALKKLPLPDLGLDFSSFIMDDEEKVISLNLEVLSYTTKTPRGGPLVYDKLSSYYGVNALMDR